MLNPKIAVIDVETPNRNNDCICSIGVCVIDNEKIIDEFYTLVNPKCKFDDFNINIHGITPKDVIDAPTFLEVWEKLKMYFDGYIIAGHNVSFDLGVINQELNNNRIVYSTVASVDTLSISRNYLTLQHYKLNNVCEKLGIELINHHCALDDCKASADILIAIDKIHNINIAKHIKQYEFYSSLKEYYPDSSDYNIRYSRTTESLWELQELLDEVVADGIVEECEIEKLSNWLFEHEDLKGNFPYDSIYRKLVDIYATGTIDKEKCKNLLEYLYLILNPIEATENPNEEIDLGGAIICLTGDFECGSKDDFAFRLESYGATIKKGVVKNLTYLIVGSLGSSQWSQGNYGNKIKKAMEYNDKGSNIVIIKEEDFLDLTNID